MTLPLIGHASRVTVGGKSVPAKAWSLGAVQPEKFGRLLTVMSPGIRVYVMPRMEYHEFQGFAVVVSREEDE